MDVDVVVRKDRQDLSEAARHVAIGHRKAISEAEFEVDIGEVDRVPDVAKGQEFP